MLFSQIIPPLLSPSKPKSLFFTSVSLLLSRIQGHHYHLSKFHIYTLIYCIGVFLSGLLHLYNRLQFHPPLFNSWVIFHCVYIPQLSFPFICRWTSRLLPCPGYCKQCCDEYWGTHVSFNSGFLGVYVQQCDCWVVWQFYFLPGESTWTWEPGGLQSMEFQRVRQDWGTKHTAQCRFIGYPHVYAAASKNVKQNISMNISRW